MPRRETIADPLTERRVALIDGAILVDAARSPLGAMLQEAGQRAVADPAQPGLRCCGMSREPATSAGRGLTPFQQMLRSLR